MTTDTSEKDLVAARRLWVINRRAPGLTAWQQHLQHRRSRHDIVDPRIAAVAVRCDAIRWPAPPAQIEQNQEVPTGRLADWPTVAPASSGVNFPPP